MRSLEKGKKMVLGTVASRVVPEVTDLDNKGMSRFFGLIETALQDRPEDTQKQFGLFLGVVRWLPLLRFGKSFERLGPEQQDVFLRWLEDCPVRVFRQGFWGLKAFIFMGYYGQPELWQKIGYAPSMSSPARSNE
jgi:hypothetical protein